jgi:SPP1 gp7 family putative phage head morphogenesis protein
LERQATAAANGYRSGGAQGAYRAAHEYRNAIEAALIPSLELIARQFWTRFFKDQKQFSDLELKIFADFTSYLDSALSYIKRKAGDLVTAIDMTTRNIIKRTIEKGVENGEGVDEIAKGIEDDLKKGSRARAERIARTEAHRAAQVAQYEAAAATGIDYDRVWVATEDARTRQTHHDADAQTVGMAEYFIVGDAELKYPGDPDGPPEETINCRCTTLFEPKRVNE